MPIPFLVAILAAAAPLLALGFEYWPGLAPCALCLWQRWPYWVAAGLAVLAGLLPQPGRVWLLRAAAAAVAVSGAIAALHLGVEQGWWPSPLPACLAPSVGASVSVDDLLRNMTPLPSKPCDEPAYLIPGLPVSIAGMNLIYALLLSAWILRRASREAAGR
ncbi:disulfide bond formation protein B [Falsiroseomonas tokyonensis]|uniref:Disulfide bond formation protein B n=1 Tax=Falsiroseomonas tokyonensis TaxID=430521 RepID=A0ABV7BV49_9PROT|nr:disulfide bond formation protein B [Falsiroseomonas tokyonensis]MBU8538296.1 disulfide bond formation protein B [Falsiroseomonas tokyonensis]